MSNIVEVRVPDIGDFDEVDIIEVLVAAGDEISEEQSLITVESDKASMEIPSSHAGLVKSVKVKVGDKVGEGAVILELESQAPAASAADDEAAAPDKASAATEEPAEPAAGSADAAPDPGGAAAPAGAQAAAATGEQAVRIPDIGDFAEVDVIEVLVSEGQEIARDQSLITVESDKASMEIPSPVSGTVKTLKVKVGDKVAEGSEILIAQVTQAPAEEAPQEPAAAAPAATPAAEPATPAAEAATAKAAESPAPSPAALPAGVARQSPTAAFADSELPLRNLPHASPGVRKFARELGVDLTQVSGSAPKNRITYDDVRSYVKQSLATTGTSPMGATVSGGEGFSVLGWPKVDFASFGPIDVQPLSRIRKISGANLHRNWVMIPHVTNNDVADITELEALRKQLNKEHGEEGPKMTMLAFLIRACVAALQKFPQFNASLEGDSLVYKQYFHIGFAADTPNGLVVPVIRDADSKGVLDLARETAELAAQARAGKLTPSQMQGGCFTISSLGGIGGTDFTPIINAPEVAILGVSRSVMQPVWDGKAFHPRLMLPLSLSYDHRVIDGAAAARFNAYLAALLADFRRVVL